MKELLLPFPIKCGLLSLSVVCFSASFFSIYSFFISFLLLAAHIIIFVRNPFYLKTKIFVFIVFFNLFVFVESIGHDIYFNFFIKIFLISLYCIGIGISLSGPCEQKDKTIISVLRSVLVIHSFFFAVQFIVFQLNGYYIDFDSIVRQEAGNSLYLTKALDDHLIKLRATGVFSEPSFYSMAVLPFSALLLFIERRVSPYSFIGLATSGLSLSIASLLVLILLLMYYFIRVGFPFYIKLLFFVFMFFTHDFFIDFYNSRVNIGVDYDAVNERVAIFEEFRVRGDLLNIFGSGFLWDETKPVGVTGMSGHQVRDSSFYVYILYCSGVVGFLIFFSSLYIYLKSNPELLIIIFILCFFKYHVVNGLFLLILTFYGVASKSSCPERLAVGYFNRA